MSTSDEINKLDLHDVADQLGIDLTHDRRRLRELSRLRARLSEGVL